MNNIVRSDALEFLRNIPDQSVDLILTDPPYYIPQKSIVVMGFTKHKNKNIYEAEKEWKEQWKSLSAYMRYMKDVFKEFQRIIKPQGHIVVWCSIEYYSFFLQYFRKDKPRFIPFVWIKTNPSLRLLGGSFQLATEYAFIIPNSQAFSNKTFYIEPLGQAPNYFVAPLAPSSRFSKLRHPSAKHASVIGYLIAYLSKPQDIVLDPFAGSGTTPAVARIMGRNFLACDYDQQWVDYANERLKNPEQDIEMLKKYLEPKFQINQEVYYHLYGKKDLLDYERG